MKGRYGVKKKNGKAVVLGVLAVIAALMVACVVGVAALCQSWLEDLPDYTNAEAFSASAPSVVYAYDSDSESYKVLAEFQLENRDPVELDAISKYVLKGTVATEDERFYSHNGVDILGVGRAVVNNLLGGDLEGASTITQQFVRNTILSDEMTDISFKRKVREMYISLKLEEQFSKDEILLMYLNTINYGGGAYGIEAASERYFSKHASDLTLNEAATLIGIPQSPTYNSPLYSLENCTKRRNVVLDRMVSNNVITQEEADAVKTEPIVLSPTEPSTTGILDQPYFTSYVRNQLMNPEGKYAYSIAEIFEGGLSIYTTLDLSTQRAAELAADEKLDEAGQEFEVSLVAIDPDNGHIKAMIGGKDYDQYQANMATGEGTSGRQPGSSFKLFTLVAALEAGIDPDTMIDAGESVKVPGSSDVHNVGNRDYGTVSIARAFAVSSNTAFIRLTMSLGVDKVIDAAERMGITSPMQHVAGLTLGISSVNPLEMADAYATVANGGTHYEPECIERIVDRSGNVIVDNSNPVGERAISKEVACAAIDVMKGVVTGGTGTAARLSNGQEAGGKTGTTELGQDSWFCGITPQYAVAIWLGERTDNYVDAKPVRTTAASVFSGFLNRVLAGEPIEKFPEADSPAYRTYTDEENHIGGYYGGSSSSSSSSSSASNASGASSSSSAGTSSGAGPSSGEGPAEGEDPGSPDDNVPVEPDPL